jgi:chromosome segregation protein
MYLKRLEMFGFKSFADKTALVFEPGITGVVGPNGCGKSNIFDAIRWVLGEQSVKELRGSSMEDVIFNGTDKKASLGFAEVSLTFSNENRALPIEYDEVTITRRLFRSGESEYLLNKTVVRLKDINELLMGTGIGAEAYSLVQQGKVDLVVSSKPEDRRMILDEASGITKYKSKKREALNKLKDTDNNLLRINDIVVEVKRQITSIERQANKARKYKDEFEKLKFLEVRVAQSQLGTFNQKREEVLSQIEECLNRERKLVEEIGELNTRLENEIIYFDEIEQKINEVRADEIKLDNKINLAQNQISFNVERIENFNQMEQRYKEQKEQLIERCRLQQIKIEELVKSVQVIEETIESNRKALVVKQDELGLLEKIIRDSKAKIQDHEEKILGLTSQQMSIRNSLTDVMKEIQGSLARKKRLEMENDKVLSEKQQINLKLQNVDYQMNALKGSMLDLNQRKEQQEKAIEEKRNCLNDLENRIDDLEKKKLFYKSQKEFTEKLHAQYQDIPDPVVESRFFTTHAPLEHHTGIIGKVKDVKQVADDDSIKSRLAQTTEKVYEIVCETKFIELDLAQISAKIDEIREEIVLFTWQKEEAAAELNKEEDSFKGLEQEMVGKEKNFSVLEAQKGDVLVEVNKIVGELQIVDSELAEVEHTLLSAKSKEEALNFQLDTVNQDINWCQNEIKSKQDFITSKSSEKETLNLFLVQVKADIDSDQDKLKAQNDNRIMFVEDLDRWLEEIKKIDDEVNSQKEKVERYVRENEELEANIVDIEQEKTQLTAALNDHETLKNDLAQKINSVRVNISSLNEEIEIIKRDVHEKQMEEQKIVFNERALKDRLAQAYKINLDEITLFEAPVLSTPQAETLEIPAVEGQAPETLAVQPEPINPNAKFEEEVRAMRLEDMMVEVERLRKRCESFGSVNLVAIEEFEELKGRFEFLTQQQADLLEAKSQLMATIQKINRSTRQMFMDTFTKVSEEFRIYFRMLFGGGEAQLVLLDPENVLESGIEIIARPPGKKLQSISLMSGGEKTLTAIALIFGVFKVNPSPFCVLDEIDAALDESNVGRFSYLLKDFSKIAQFIVITHNKKTIASSDVLYGITMPETGVSRIVSVKFKDEKPVMIEEPVVAA